MSIQPTIDWLAIVSLLGAVQGIFLAFIFLNVKKGNKLANRLLGWLLLTQSLSVLEVILCYTDLIHSVPFMVNAAEPLDFALGPLLFLYTLAILQPSFRLRPVHLLHFVVPVLYTLFMIPYYLQSNVFKLKLVAEDYHRPYQIEASARQILWFPDYFRNTFFVDLLDTFLIFPYLAFTLLAVYQYRQKQKQPESSNLTLKWLVNMCIYFIMLYIIGAFFSFSSEGDLGDIYIALAISLIFYGISYQVIMQSQFLSVTVEETVKKKYAKSSLTSEHTDTLKERLLEFMQTQKPYLSSELTMPQLAEKLHLSPHQLSQVINEQFDESFYDFINGYRIEAVKKALINPKLAHLKIEEIAYQCGFNSKSAFHVAFRKSEGITPSQYRKKLSAKA